jgi:uncharacterized Rmd1/YagE family protein
MRCISFCTANSYKLNAIADFFKAKHFSAKLYRNVLHVTKSTTGGSSANMDIFFFHNGCFVTWGLQKEQEQKIIAQIKIFSIEPLEKIESDRFIFRPGKKTTIASHQRFNADLITIDMEEADNVQIKLAISYGLAQSVKLEAYEESIQTTIDNHSPIPHQLAKTGKISLSRRAISKRLGEIFLERSSVILKGEYFDVPEYFWRYSNLETYYLMTEKFLDIPKRVASLNHKLDVLHEIFDMLNNQLQHRYSSILETVIILLILIEIVQNFVHHF